MTKFFNYIIEKLLAIVKILAIVIGVILMSTGWQDMFDGWHHIFDSEGYNQWEEQKKLEENFRKSEAKRKEDERNRKSVENIIKDVHFSKSSCSGDKSETNNWIVVCFDRAKKDLPSYKIKVGCEIYTISDFEPYIFDFLINESDCNGLSSCQDKRIYRPSGRTPDYKKKWFIDEQKRYKEIIEGKIEKVVIQVRDYYDYENIWLTKIYKDF